MKTQANPKWKGLAHLWKEMCISCFIKKQDPCKTRIHTHAQTPLLHSPEPLAKGWTSMLKLIFPVSQSSRPVGRPWTHGQNQKQPLWKSQLLPPWNYQGTNWSLAFHSPLSPELCRAAMEATFLPSTLGKQVQEQSQLSWAQGTALSQIIINASVLSNHRPLWGWAHARADAEGNIHLCGMERATKMS